jgi:phospholipid transport system substrate-binding protein
MKANFLALIVVFISLTSLTANAAPYPAQAGYPIYETQYSEPAAILKTGISKLTAFIKSGGAQNREEAMAFLKSEIAPFFDFAYMTRWAAGPAWRHMRPEQKAMMQEQLTDSFMTTLVQNLASYNNQPIRYFTPRGQSSNDVNVRAWIMQPRGYPTKLEFRFYRSNNGWKIFDVKADGNSAVVYYKKQFRHMYSYSDSNYPYR